MEAGPIFETRMERPKLVKAVTLTPVAEASMDSQRLPLLLGRRGEDGVEVHCCFKAWAGQWVAWRGLRGSAGHKPSACPWVPQLTRRPQSTSHHTLCHREDRCELTVGKEGPLTAALRVSQ